MSEFKKLQERYQFVQDRIASAAKESGRSSDEIQLIVVTKGHPVSSIEDLYALGARRFGESRIDASYEKIMALSDKSDINWHMIGHIQSRKAQVVCQHFNFVHSIDSLKLARRMSRFVEPGNVLPVLLQCNVSGETTKSGWDAKDEKGWEALIPEIAEAATLPGIEVQGLMTMAPYSSTPESARPYFLKTRNLRDFFAKQLPAYSWHHLSMGMSGDYEVAIREGATLVRVGSAILATNR